MLSAIKLGFLATGAVAIEYVYTPAGPMRSDCVHNVPSGSTVVSSSGAFLITSSDGKQLSIPKCKGSPETPVLQTVKHMPVLRTQPARNLSLPSGHVAFRGRKLQLPADYDGWLQYAAFNYQGSPSIGAFLSNMSVPTSLPKGTPDVLYFFPGLQNKDWVPKVDPYGNSKGFDIIQPVLQYPGDAGNYYSVKSWWVTTDEGALASDQIKLEPGAVIECNMTKTGPQQWFIDAAVSGRGGKKQHTSVTAQGLGDRLASQPWAYAAVMECYGCSSCDMLPQNNASSVYSAMRLLDEAGNPISPTWLPNPKPAKDRTCPSSIQIVDASTVITYPGTS